MTNPDNRAAHNKTGVKLYSKLGLWKEILHSESFRLKWTKTNIGREISTNLERCEAKEKQDCQ